MPIGRGAVALVVASSLFAGVAEAATVKVAPDALRPIAKVDPRFLSYNVEMAEVIGGRFWAPYLKPGEPQPTTPGDHRFRDRPPLDLEGNRRLRTMAKALGPAYMRVSGTWANSAYFQDDDKPPLKAPPAGYKGVLTRAQWAGVIDFAKAVDAKIVTSFAVGDGARNPDRSWNDEGAQRLLRLTRSLGGEIVAVEPINEPSLDGNVGMPKGYGPADFARDNQAFKSLLDREAPGIRFVGPSGTSDVGNFLIKRSIAKIPTEALLSAPGVPRFDVFSYHVYTSISERCISAANAAKPELALTDDWLGEIDRVDDYYRSLRDRFEPGAPIWVTEIGEAGCGGDRWASTFADTFRYVDNMARLAKRGVAATFHNTLAASDYALIDDATMLPRPSYWAAVLWRRLMDATVLDAGPIQPGLHLYAHCLRGKPGGVSLVAINLDRANPATLDLPVAAQRYTLTADELQSRTVKLNGRTLALTADDQLPSLTPAQAQKGRLTLAPASITFLALPGAANPACRAE